MVTPEYVDYLINEVIRLKIPPASATLRRSLETETLVRYDWIVSNCPHCGQEHTEYAGYNRDDLHQFLGRHYCLRSKRYYIMMRDYDFDRDRDKLHSAMRLFMSEPEIERFRIMRERQYGRK